MFYHSITEFVFLMNILGKRSDLPFSRKSDRKKEKSTVSFTHVQNIICSQTQLNGSRGGRGGLPANEKKEKFASNDNLYYTPYRMEEMKDL